MTAIPGQSNDPSPAKRALENALIRQMRSRARFKGLGYGTGQQDMEIRRAKKRLYGV